MTEAFVGRERELGLGLAALDDALEGRGRLVLVSGEAGIGKSRLADELAAVAHSRGAEVLWGRCWEDGGAPAYWPWVQSIRAHGGSDNPDGPADVAPPELAELLGGAGLAPGADSEAARFRLFDAAAGYLRRAAARRPLVIVLDDLHAADDSSLLLLRFIGAELAGSRLLIVGCYRDAGVGPVQPLSPTLRDLARERATRKIPLAGIARQHVGRYIELASGIEPSATLVGAIHAKTEGNPLYFGELITLLLRDQDLHDGGLRLTLTLPESLRDVIGRRLQQLSPPSLTVLTVASVLGREFAIDALSEVLNGDTHALGDALEEAQAQRLLIDVPERFGRLQFTHALVRDALYEQLSALRRPALHRRAAEVLEVHYGDAMEAHLAELARHWTAGAQASDALRASDYARRAGDRASATLAFEEAARLYEMALATLDMAVGGRDQTRCELLLRLGDAYTRAGDLATAQRAFLDAAVSARKLGQPEAFAWAALGYGGRFVWEAMRGDRNLGSLLEEALAALGDEPSVLRARLMARLAGGPLRIEARAGRREALSADAVALARTLDDDATLAYALDGRCAAVWGPDNLEQRLPETAELVSLAAQIGDEERELQGRHYRSLALLELGDMPGVYDELEAKARLARALRQPAHDWYVATMQATVATFEGRLADAERLIPHAFRAGRRAQGSIAPVCTTIQRYLLLRMQGRLEEMQDELADMAATFPAHPVLRCLVAHLHAELGRATPARRELERLVLPFDNGWVFGTSLLADVVAFIDDRERAADMRAALLPYAGRFAVSNPDGCAGSVARPLGVLAASCGDWNAASDHFAEAVERNTRAGSRPWAAQARLDWARMRVMRDAPGDREKARQLLLLALATAREMGAGALEAKTSSLLAAISAPATAETGGGAVFRREGDYWSVRYAAAAFRIRDGKGMRYLAELLASPGREFAALALAAALEGAAQPSGMAARTRADSQLGGSGGDDAGDVLDADAREAYRQRLSELDEQVEEGERFNDPERAARARAEIDALTVELSAALGLGGRARRVPGHAERARQSVTKAIRTTIRRVGEHDPALAAHLERTIQTGALCRYDPDPRAGVRWTL